jgi:uncharacterized protein (DUF488 family)
VEILYTIGHSTRPIAEFIELLRDSSIEVVVDVRTVPRSRTNPQYNRDVLPASLAAAGIGYEHLPTLGGLRGRSKETPPDVNAYWQNESFHNYADYALTTPFREGLDALRALAQKRRAAIMCSEAVWWRCHRRIISDYLLHAGVRVHHIQSKARVEPAQITPAAKPGPGGTLTYPPESSLF